MKKGVIFTIVIVVLFIIFYFLFLHKRKGSETDNINNKNEQDEPNDECSSKAFVYKKGEKGKAIKNIQKYLNKAHDFGIAEDSIWGSETQEAWEKHVSMIVDKNLSACGVKLDDYNFIKSYLNYMETHDEIIDFNNKLH